MATETTKTAKTTAKTTAQATAPTRKTYENVKAKVVNVRKNDEGDRLIITTDKEFETISYESQEFQTTNAFSLNIVNLVNQIGSQIDAIQLANVLSLGKLPNVQIIALALTNAEIEFTREHKLKGERRKNTDEVYSNDCVISNIVKAKENISPIAAKHIDRLLMTQPSEPEDKNNFINPFNV